MTLRKRDAFDRRDRADHRLRPVFRDGQWLKEPIAPQDRVVYLTRAKNYVMCRKPGCIPFVVGEKEWLSLPVWEP